MLWSHLFWTMRVAFDAWQGTNRGNGNWRRQDKIRRGTCRSNSRKCIVNVLMFTCLLLVQCSLLCDADGPIKHISILRPKHLDEFGKALWYLAALLAGCPKNFNECPSVQMQIIHVEHCWALSIISMGSRRFQGVQMFWNLASCDASSSFILQHVVRKLVHSATSFNLQHPMLAVSGQRTTLNTGLYDLCMRNAFLAYIIKWLFTWNRAKPEVGWSIRHWLHLRWAGRIWKWVQETILIHSLEMIFVKKGGACAKDRWNAK